MGSPQDAVDHVLFGLLPYLATIVCVVVFAAHRYRVPPFGAPPQHTEPQPYGERLLFGYGVLIILGGHLAAFLIPDQIRLWNNDLLRLYILEVSGLVFALLTLAGLLLTMGRCLRSAEARQGMGFADWLLYVVLLLQVGGGIGVAILYPWGMSWYPTSVLPYVRSLLRLEPDIGTISPLPHLVKLHVVGASVLLFVLPFTRVVRPLIIRSWEEEPRRTLSRLTTNVLLIGLVFSLLPLVSLLWGAPLPGSQRGYEPAQPIAFSHRLHAGELQMSCLYCHGDAEKGPHASIASAGVCMNCHRFVSAPIRDVRAEAELAKEENRKPRTLISPELRKLYAALGLNDQLQADPNELTTPIRWVNVHNLPSFTRFDHRAHVNAGVECQRCHGPVETMERVRQVEDLSMGWCVQCHRTANEEGIAGREVHPSNDCATCHH